MLFVKLSSHKKVSAGAGCVGPHSDFLQNLTLDGAGMRMKQVSFSELLQKEVRRDCPAIITAGAGCVGPHSDFLQNLTLDGAGMRMKQVSFSELLQKGSRRDCPATKEVLQEPSCNKNQASAALDKEQVLYYNPFQ